MQRAKSWTLTDIASDVWLDTFSTGGDIERRPGTLSGGVIEPAKERFDRAVEQFRREH